MTLPTAPSTPDHERILASAGSGKTYQLTSRYLKLIARGVRPQAILASTFTRLAAGEIRSRILMRLVEAVDDEPRRKALRDELELPVLSREDALDMLASLARRVHLMNIRTLDSFFASIVRAFALELNVQPGSDVVDDEQAAGQRREAIRRLLDERDPQELIELLRLLTQGHSERAVTDTIDRTVRDLHTIFRQATDDAWYSIAEPSGYLRPPSLAAAIDRFVTLDVDGDKRFIKAHANEREQALRHDWAAFIDGGLAGRIIAGETTYHGKEIEPGVLDAYQPIIDHARAVLVERERRQMIASRDVLKLFHTQYERLKRRDRVMTFNDLVWALNDADSVGALDDICYRLDAQIEHVLLDEFQDTSAPQWRALSPLITELASDATRGRTVFCVGDVKQSIYRWRDAAPRILESLPQLVFGEGGESAMHTRELAKSWRSSPAVIDAVNRVFGTLRDNPSLAALRDIAADWATGFVTHQTHRTDLSGAVELHVYEADGPAKDCRRRRLVEAARLAARLHTEAPGLCIGVLTRTNASAARVLYELGPGGVNAPASGRGGGPLTDTPAVNAVLDLLRLADHPDDTVAAFNVAHSPLAAVISVDHKLAQPDKRGLRAAVGRTVRQRLIEHGYARTIGGWAAALAPTCDERSLRRLLALVELAEAHDPARALSTAPFVQLVEQQRVIESRAAPIEVMNIHQSKGLEFDAVILPELDGALTGIPPAVVCQRDGVVGPIVGVCRYVNEMRRSLMPEIQPLFDAWRESTVREALCTMYVAITRARQGLYMLIDEPKTRKASSTGVTAGEVICAAMTDGESVEPGLAWRTGDASWHTRAVHRPLPESSPVPQITIRLARARDGVRRGVSAAPPSMSYDDTSGRRFRLPARESLDRGTAVHALFEQIEWIDDFQPDDAALSRLIQQRLPRRDAAWCSAIIADFRAMLDAPAIRNALSKPEGALVWRERPFVRRTEEGVQQGAIDRLVAVRDDDDRWASAQVSDFKTDRIDPADASVAAQSYRAQMHAYRDVAARWLDLPVESITMTLLFVEPGAAVSVE